MMKKQTLIIHGLANKCLPYTCPNNINARTKFKFIYRNRSYKLNIIMYKYKIILKYTLNN